MENQSWMNVNASASEHDSRIRRIEVQFCDIATHSAHVLSVRWKTKCIVVDLDHGLALFDLLRGPELGHEDVDSAVFGLVTGAIENGDA